MKDREPCFIFKSSFVPKCVGGDVIGMLYKCYNAWKHFLNFNLVLVYIEPYFTYIKKVHSENYTMTITEVVVYLFMSVEALFSCTI